MEYQLHTLENGIRLLHKTVPSPVAHCCLLINAGSRDENPDEHGLAHFIEHAFFKGTAKRKPWHILNHMEAVGGEIDAFTTKENTCLLATFLREDYTRAVDLISDIAFNSVFPDKELEKEKEVIYEEINSYKDSPTELIFDDFEELIFRDHPIGRNILGTKQRIRKFDKAKIEAFMKRNYHTDQMIFASVGSISFNRLVKIFTTYFSQVPANLRKNARLPVEIYKPEKLILKKRTFQSHCIVGNLAFDAKNDFRTALGILINILGGPGMNSRLNLVLREKYGLVYSVEANYSAYEDTGIVSIYFGTEKDSLEKCLELIHQEINVYRTTMMNEVQLARAKRQIKGQIAVASDNNANLLLTLSKSHLLYNQVDSLKDVYQKVDLVTGNDIMDIANRIFDPKEITTLVYQ